LELRLSDIWERELELRLKLDWGQVRDLGCPTFASFNYIQRAPSKGAAKIIDPGNFVAFLTSKLSFLYLSLYPETSANEEWTILKIEFPLNIHAYTLRGNTSATVP
jgi:hypothetical protein